MTSGNSRPRGGPSVQLPDLTQVRNDLLAVRRRQASSNPQSEIVCVTATGNPGTFTGLTQVTWTPPAQIYDTGPFFPGNTSNTSIRIPVNGFYNFHLHWICDAVGSDYSIEVRMEVAPTSDSGIGSPSFAEPIATYRHSKFVRTGTLDRFLISDYNGVELHANDLVQFRIRTDLVAGLSATTVITSEFRLLYPIPHNAVIN
jgi:hypothetical protein